MEGGLAAGFMEDAHMSARTTRQAARARIMAAMQAELNRLIPEDESIPLKGMRLSDFEDQVEGLAQAALPTILEERTALEPNARVETAGRCPHCGSVRTYLRRDETQAELLSLHGKLVLTKQHARCRACGESFSPSGS